jgi:hypothetical protein
MMNTYRKRAFKGLASQSQEQKARALLDASTPPSEVSAADRRNFFRQLAMRIHEGRGRDIVSVMVEGGGAASLATSTPTDELRAFLANASLHPDPEGLEAVLLDEYADTASDLLLLKPQDLQEMKDEHAWFKTKHVRKLERAIERLRSADPSVATADAVPILDESALVQEELEFIRNDSDVSAESKEQTTKFFNSLVRERCGLLSLVATETDPQGGEQRRIYRFPHLTFQEYFASEQMIEDIEKDLEGKEDDAVHEVFERHLGKDNESKLYDVWYREIVLFITCGLKSSAFEKLVDFLLSTDDGIGAVQTRVYQMLKERGMLDSNDPAVVQQRQQIYARISQTRTTEFMARALMHPAPALRELALTELREYKMDGMSIAAAIEREMELAKTSERCKAAGLHSIGLLDYASTADAKGAVVAKLVAIWMDTARIGYSSRVKEEAGTAVAALQAHASPIVVDALCARLRNGDTASAKEAIEIIKSFKMMTRSGSYLASEAEDHTRGRDLVDAIMELMESSPWVVSVIADWGQTDLAFKRMDRVYTADPSYALTLLGAFIGKGVFAESQPGFQYAAEKITYHLQAKTKAGEDSGGAGEDSGGADAYGDAGAWRIAMQVAMDHEELLKIAAIRASSMTLYYRASTGDAFNLLLVSKLPTLKSFEVAGENAVDTVLLHMLRNGSTQLKVRALMVGVRLLPTEQAVDIVRELEVETDEKFKTAWLDDMVSVLPAKEVLENILKLLREGGSEHLRMAAVSMCKPFSWANADFADLCSLWASVQSELLAMLKRPPPGAHSVDSLRSVTLRKKAFSVLVAQFNHNRMDYGGGFTEAMLQQEIHTMLAAAESSSSSDFAMQLAALDELKGSLASHNWCRIDSIKRLIVVLITQQDADGDNAQTSVNMDQRRLRVQESAMDLLPSLDEATRATALLSLLQGEGVHPEIKRAAIKMAYAPDFSHESRIRSVLLAFIAGGDQPDLQLQALSAFSSARCSLTAAEGGVILSLVRDTGGDLDVRVAAVQMLPQLSVEPTCVLNPAQTVAILADLFEECVARVQDGHWNTQLIEVVLALMADAEAVLAQPRVIAAIGTLFSAVSERENGKTVQVQALLKLMSTMMGQWLQKRPVGGAEVAQLAIVDPQQDTAQADDKLQSSGAKCFVRITTSLASGTNERLAEVAVSILSTFGQKADLSAAAPVIDAMVDRLVDIEAAPFVFTPLLEYHRRQRDAFFEERAKNASSEEKGWDLDASTLLKLQSFLRTPPPKGIKDILIEIAPEKAMQFDDWVVKLEEEDIDTVADLLSLSASLFDSLGLPIGLKSILAVYREQHSERGAPKPGALEATFLMKDLKVGKFCDGSIPYWKGDKIKAPKVLTKTAATSAVRAALTDLASKKALRMAPTSEVLGPMPTDRSWQDEWELMIKEDGGSSPTGIWASAAAFHDACVSTGNNKSRLDAGFSPEDAEVVDTLNAAVVRRMVSRSLADGSDRYGVYTHTILNVLTKQAAKADVAPKCYCALFGTGKGKGKGLADVDPRWAAIAKGDAKGVRGLRTYGPLLFKGANKEAFSPKGLQTNLQEGYEVADSTVVCVESMPSEGQGRAFHSAVGVGGNAYALPPLTHVEVVSVEEGSFEYLPGKRIQQTLVTVRPTYGAGASAEARNEGAMTWASSSDVIFERESPDRIRCKRYRGDSGGSTWRCCAFGSTLMSTGTYTWELTTSQEAWVHIGVCTDEYAGSSPRFERAEGSGVVSAAEEHEAGGDPGGSRPGCWLLGLYFNELLLDGKPPGAALGENAEYESPQGFTTEITVTYSESTGSGTLQFVRAGNVVGVAEGLPKNLRVYFSSPLEGAGAWATLKAGQSDLGVRQPRGAQLECIVGGDMRDGPSRKAAGVGRLQAGELMQIVDQQMAEGRLWACHVRDGKRVWTPMTRQNGHLRLKPVLPIKLCCKQLCAVHEAPKKNPSPFDIVPSDSDVAQLQPGEEIEVLEQRTIGTRLWLRFERSAGVGVVGRAGGATVGGGGGGSEHQWTTLVDPLNARMVNFEIVLEREQGAEVGGGKEQRPPQLTAQAMEQTMWPCGADGCANQTRNADKYCYRHRPVMQGKFCGNFLNQHHPDTTALKHVTKLNLYIFAVSSDQAHN